MTRDEIINMARESGLVSASYVYDGTDEADWKDIERFAALVAAAERQSRQAAQIENEALKARIARADVELQRAVIAEREACAQVCQARSETPFPQTPRGLGFSFSEAWRAARGAEELCAAAIRARGAA